MPTTSPWSSYVAPPESPEITSLLISIRPRSFSLVLPSWFWVVMCWSSAVTVPVAALKVVAEPPASPTAVTASPTAAAVVAGWTTESPLALVELEHGDVVLGVGADHGGAVVSARCSSR